MIYKKIIHGKFSIALFMSAAHLDDEDEKQLRTIFQLGSDNVEWYSQRVLVALHHIRNTKPYYRQAKNVEYIFHM